MILVIQSAGTGERRFPLQRGVLTLGRGADCDLVLADSQASRRHAELRRAGERWQIVDLGSTNGTFVSSSRLAPNAAYTLRSGEIITIGSTRLRLLDEAPAAVPQAAAPPPAPDRADAARPSLLLMLLTWFSRLLTLAGAAALIAGAQADWLGLAVTLPLLGNVFSRTINGAQTGYAYLLIGVAAFALLLLLVDLLSRRWGLAAGLAQALLGGLTAAILVFNAYNYYQAGAQSLFGVSMLDILTQYARDFVQITVLPGIYLVGGGLAGLILGGLLRLLFAGMER